MKNLGKQSFLIETVYADGSPAISIMSEPLTVYERADGSCFYKYEGRRVNLTREPDGSFLLRSVVPSCPFSQATARDLADVLIKYFGLKSEEVEAAYQQCVAHQTMVQLEAIRDAILTKRTPLVNDILS